MNDIRITENDHKKYVIDISSFVDKMTLTTRDGGI